MKIFRQFSVVIVMVLCINLLTAGLEEGITGSKTSSIKVETSYAKTKKTSKKKNPSSSSAKKIYYVPKGKSYHKSKSCQSLSRSKVILSGTISEAIKLGKGDPCDFCY